MLKFYCTHCGQRISANEKRAGVTAKCPACQGSVTVPGTPISTPDSLPAGTIADARSPIPTPDSVTANPYSPLLSSENVDIASIPHRRHAEGIRRLSCFWIFLGLGIFHTLFNSSDPTGIAMLMVALGYVLAAYSRLKNIGMNPWWCLLMIVPFANLIVVIRCLAFQENYQNSKKLDKAGKIIASIVIGIIGLLLIAAIISVF
jgi:hypothetical protein